MKKTLAVTLGLVLATCAGSAHAASPIARDTQIHRFAPAMSAELITHVRALDSARLAPRILLRSVVPAGAEEQMPDPGEFSWSVPR